MTLIDTLRPQHRQWLRRLRKRLANRDQMRRSRQARKLCCIGVDLPIEAGTCGRLAHAEHQRCIYCARRRWWLLRHALNDVELDITAILEDDTAPRAIHDDTRDHLPAVVPILDEVTDLGDPCLRW